MSYWGEDRLSGWPYGQNGVRRHLGRAFVCPREALLQVTRPPCVQGGLSWGSIHLCAFVGSDLCLTGDLSQPTVKSHPAVRLSIWWQMFEEDGRDPNIALGLRKPREGHLDKALRDV